MRTLMDVDPSLEGDGEGNLADALQIAEFSRLRVRRKKAANAKALKRMHYLAPRTATNTPHTHFCEDNFKILGALTAQEQQAIARIACCQMEEDLRKAWLKLCMKYSPKAGI
ncbi:hypothetical protein DFQ28_002217 [Apophysomyces sp. BC1034]|nr:hypothetical protein DFQ29_001611 [Apophysomyces sp. BC1021]KAG0190332.1 hypothetical protein DFQ28_002217 [Apophysomyces sp. BC1034]